MEPRRRYWFKAKRYGYGWTPASVEGWLVLAGAISLYLGAILGAAALASEAAVLAVTIAGAVVMTAGLVAISRKTGEPARWRWGGE